MTPLGAIVRGAVAGAVGTLAMDLVWYSRYRRGGGTDGFAAWEFSADQKSWDAAPAPALLGKRVYEGVFQRSLPPERAALTNNVVHWATGAGWGAGYGLVAGSLPASRLRDGLIFGPAVWASSYVILPAAGLYKPIWAYDARTLAKDLSAHLVYGLTSASVFRVLAGRRDPARGLRGTSRPARNSDP
jgi:hypothetical protein